MTCNAGTWTGSPTGYAYKWYSSAAEISGQTASTYTVTATTEGTPLTCAVAGTNAAGTSAYTMASNTIENFVPGDLGNIAVWFDASDMSRLFQDSGCSSPVVSNGDSVGCWKDKSSANKNATQATATLQPTFVSNTSTINNKPTLRGDGINDWLSLENPIPGTGSFSTAVLSVNEGGNGGRVPFAGGWGSTTAFYALNYYFPGQGGTKFVWAWGSGNGAALSNQNGNDGQWHLGFSKYTGTTHSVRLDGVDGTSTPKNNSNLSGGWGIFNTDQSLVPSNHMRGNIAEIVLFTTALSSSDTQRLEGYLAHKWGLTANLPSSPLHPYKTTAPTP
jgi:hypothetical protein